MPREIATKIDPYYLAKHDIRRQFDPVLLGNWRQSSKSQAFRDRN
jgi:hypothetical protein